MVSKIQAINVGQNPNLGKSSANTGNMGNVGITYQNV